MIDPTNSPEVVQSLVTSAPTTFNAWHVVALLIGGLVIHTYHAVVNAGGYMAIARRFKYGPMGSPNSELRIPNSPAPPQDGTPGGKTA